METQAAALLESIRSARLEHHSLFAAEHDVDLTSAYRIQAALGEGRELKGYKLVDLDGSVAESVHGRVYTDMLLTPPVSLATFLRPRLALRLAVVLGADLPPGASPGAVHLAIGALFCAIEFTDSVWADGKVSAAGAVADNACAGGFVISERLLGLPLRGGATLRLRGSPVASCALDAFEDVLARLGGLAGDVGGLRQGQTVLLGPTAGDQPVPATPGSLELWGPDGSFLAIEIQP